jgi:hypothetical protein
MNRILASVAGSLLALSLLGCPPSQETQAPSQAETSLNLRLASNSAAVGEETALDLAFGQDGSALFGAMIADDSQARLTQWHAEPADAVEFNDETSTVTFKRAGPVKIWATWTDADGSELTSNEVQLDVSGDQAAPVAQPAASEAPAETE